MEELSPKRRVYVMLALMVAMFFAAINQTIVGVALPRIISELGGMDHYSWVVTIYLLTSTIATVLIGKLSDIYGRKPFILAGIATFMVGAFMCGLSRDIFQLIAYRGIQGIGAGIIMASVFTAVGDLFPPRERGKWMGLMSAVFGLSSILGPAMGGWMVDHMDWKWLFWVFLPAGIVAFFMILAQFPRVERRPGEKIDYAGSLFLTLFLVAMLLGFSLAGTEYAWSSPQIIGLFAAALLFGGVFVRIEARAASPVLPLSLFRNDIVTISNVIGFLMTAGMMGALIYLPLFVQGVKGISPTYAGYVTMPMSITMVVTSAAIGRQITRTGKYKRFAVLGMPLMIAGMLIMAFMDSVWLAVVAMAVFGVGLGMGMPVFAVTVQNAVGPSDLGVATASAQLFRSLGGTIGIAVLGTVMNTEMRRHMEAALGPGGAEGVMGAGGASGAVGGSGMAAPDPETMQKLGKLLSPESLLDPPKLEKMRQTLPPEVQPLVDRMLTVVRDALDASLTTVFLTGTALVAVAAGLVFFLREIPLRTTNRVPGGGGGPAGDRRSGDNGAGPEDATGGNSDSPAGAGTDGAASGDRMDAVREGAAGGGPGRDSSGGRLKRPEAVR